jgi:hypothetical protein
MTDMTAINRQVKIGRAKVDEAFFSQLSVNTRKKESRKCTCQITACHQQLLKQAHV